MAGWLHTEINVWHRELNPDTVTHPSTNRARRRLTSLIEANALTTTPDHQTKYRDIALCHICVYGLTDGQRTDGRIMPPASVVVWCSDISLVLINEVNLRRARLVLGWVIVSGFNSGAGNLSRYVTSHPGQLSLAIPLWVGTMSTSQRTMMPCG